MQASSLDRPLGRLAPRHLDIVVSAFIVALALWTALFHIAVAVGLHRNITFVLWVVTCGATAGLASRLRKGSTHPSVQQSVRFDRRFLALAGVVVVGCALVAALTMSGSWWWLPWSLLFFPLATAVTLLRRESDEPSQVVSARRHSAPSNPARTVWLVVLVALAMALLSMVLQRPDEDDALLVNRSTHIEHDNGEFPTRDTIFSDEVFRFQRPPGPQSSVEAMIGTVAAMLPVSAATTTYLLFGPLVSALAVLALWRLLRTVGARAPLGALVAAMVFIVLDGASHASFGNFHFGRAWQGKAVFLMVIVPSLWHFGVRWGRHGHRRDLALLFACSTAAIGLTSSSMFVAPVVVIVATLATASYAQKLQRVPLALLALMPLFVAAVVTLRAATQPALNIAPLALISLGRIGSPRIDPAEQVYFVFGTGIALFVALAAVMLAWVVLDNAEMRLLFLLAPLAVLVAWIPGVLDMLDDLSNVNSVSWRMAWVLPVPAAVGLVATQWPVALGSLSDRFTSWNVGGAAIAAAVIMLITGTSVLSQDNQGAQLVWPPGLDIPTESTSAQRLMDLAPDGGTVAAPQALGYPIAVLSHNVYPINARWQYVTGKTFDDAFHAPARDQLTRILAGGLGDTPPGVVDQALADLQVVAICQSAKNDDALANTITAAGYRLADTDETCKYWVLR